MKIYIDKKYEHLRSDIMKVVKGDYVASRVFCHKRNVVEKISMQGGEYVVKTYKRPNWFNRFAYTYLRKSKAERAYKNALRLLEIGIETPAPVAYIEVYKKGLFSTGYLFTEYVPYNLMRNAYEGDIPDSGRRRLTKDFMEFTLDMHSKGVLPLDFNSANIFYYYDKDNQGYRFALTDINRMRFGKVPSTSAVMRSFEQFGVSVEGLYKLAVYYCARKKIDIEYSIFIFMYHRMRSRIKRAFKRKAKAKLHLW